MLCFKSVPHHKRSSEWSVQVATYDEEGNAVEAEFVFDGDRKLYTDGRCP